MTHPLGFSQSQFDAVMNAAASIPPPARKDFLDQVVTEVLENAVTDENVLRAVSAVLARRKTA